MSGPGSPPLTRGIQITLRIMACTSGFTPAHAGNTAGENRLPVLPWVHPRSRGEYCISHIRHTRTEGSPPLTRGIPQKRQETVTADRFTPAHAGNTILIFALVISYWVHPRSRGEYTKKSLILSHFFQHPFSHFI